MGNGVKPGDSERIWAERRFREGPQGAANDERRLKDVLKDPRAGVRDILLRRIFSSQGEGVQTYTKEDFMKVSQIQQLVLGAETDPREDCTKLILGSSDPEAAFHAINIHSPDKDECVQIFEIYSIDLKLVNRLKALNDGTITKAEFVSGGAFIHVPISSDVIARERTPFYRVIGDFGKKIVWAFTEAVRSGKGNGISEKELRDRFLGITDIDPEYQEDIEKFQGKRDPEGNHLQRVGFFEVTAVNPKTRNTTPLVGYAELLQFDVLYDFFRNHPEVTHVFGEILLRPYPNIATLKFQEGKFGVCMMANRIEKIRHEGMNGIEGLEDTYLVKTPGYYHWGVVEFWIYRKVIHYFDKVLKKPRDKVGRKEFIEVWRNFLSEAFQHHFSLAQVP